MTATTFAPPADDPSPERRWIVQRVDGTNVTETTGMGLIPAYMELWAQTLFYSVKIDYEFDHGWTWPVSRSTTTVCTLTFEDGGEPVQLGDKQGFFQLLLWIFGKKSSGRDVWVARTIDAPHKERLETLARTHLRTRDVDGAIKEIGLDYMKILGAPDD